MNEEIYNIIYFEPNNKQIKEQKTKNELKVFMSNYLKNSNGILCIVPQNAHSTNTKNYEKITKDKYYKSIYNHYYRKFKNNLICEKEYETIIKKLKEIKIQSKTKKDFVKRFEEYKKALTNISPYKC